MLYPKPCIATFILTTIADLSYVHLPQIFHLHEAMHRYVQSYPTREGKRRLIYLTHTYPESSMQALPEAMHRYVYTYTAREGKCCEPYVYCTETRGTNHKES